MFGRGARLCLMLLIAVPGWAAETNFSEVRSPNFTIVTDAGDNQGRQIALRFEQMRQVFASLIPREKLNLATSLRVFAFKNNLELARVAPLYNGSPVKLDGIYIKGEDRHYIALDASSLSNWDAVFHEYAHFLLNTNLPQTPLWFDEGFANYYSNIRIDKTQYQIGASPDGYLAILRSNPLMPVERLFAIMHESPEYNENTRGRSVFYAQSWLAVHWILENKKLQNATQYFVESMFRGVPVARAIENNFGMSAAGFDAALQGYLDKNSFALETVPLPPLEAGLYRAHKLKPQESAVLIAEMQLHTRDHQAEALAAFQELEQKYPAYAPVYRGLGYASYLQGDLKAAERAFRKAANLDSDDARVYYFIAYLIKSKASSSPPDPEDLIEMNEFLEKAVRIDPSYADAFDLKGWTVGNAGNQPEAINLMRVAVHLAPRVERYQMNLALQYMAAQRWQEATALLDRLQKSADPQMARAATEKLNTMDEWKTDKLARYRQPESQAHIAPQWRRKGGTKDDDEEALEARQRGDQEDKPEPPRPMRYAKGVLIGSTCQPNGEVVLRVAIGATKLKLQAPDWTKMTVIGAGEFNCNWKNKRVTLNYKERSATEGEIVSLEVTSP